MPKRLAAIAVLLLLAAVAFTWPALSQDSGDSEETDHPALLHFNKGARLEKSSQEEEAVKAYQEAIRLKPDYAEAVKKLSGSGGKGH